MMEAEIDRNEAQSMRVLAKSFKMRALLEFTRQNIGPAIQEYGDAVAQGRRIIHLIDLYLKTGDKKIATLVVAMICIRNPGLRVLARGRCRVRRVRRSDGGTSFVGICRIGRVSGSS